LQQLPLAANLPRSVQVHPKLKALLLLAKRLAPIPGFLAAFAVWGFVFTRYSDPPVDMAGRALAASIAAAASASAAKASANAPKDDEETNKHAFTPFDACLQQQALFPSQFGALECSEDDLASSFAWAWAPAPLKGEKAGVPRPRSSAREGAPVRKPDGAEPPGGADHGE